MTPTPITPEMKELLSYLRKQAKKDLPVRQADAAREFGVSVQAMNGRLFALEKKGLVRREIQTVLVPTECSVFIPTGKEPS